jgi:RNA polymerase sigma-70 factor (ECF subfamily)
MGVVIALEIETLGAGADERTLVRRAADGDLHAFETLYRSHAGRVHLLCKRLTGDAAQAEDCVQEAFVKAWKSLGAFDGRAKFSTWLHQIAVRVALDEKRKQSRRPQAATMTVAEPTAGRSSDDLRVALERALHLLPEAARHVVVLHDVYGYQHEEIATMSGWSVGASRSQLHRARLLLRKALTR